MSKELCSQKNKKTIEKKQQNRELIDMWTRYLLILTLDTAWRHLSFAIYTRASKNMLTNLSALRF